MLTGLRRIWRGSRSVSPPPGGGYKTIWDELARSDAREAILTGATDEGFETSGSDDADLVAPYLTGTERILAIGCGIGRVERYLASRVAELWAIDVSGEMIRRARERLADLPNVHLREVGDRDFLRSFGDAEFDVVFSFLVFQHLEREDAFLYLRESARVLRAGGIIVTQFPNFLSPGYTQAFVQGADVYPRSLARVRAYTEAEVRHALTTAGFDTVDIRVGGHGGRSAELYVVAKKAAAGS